MCDFEIVKSGTCGVRLALAASSPVPSLTVESGSGALEVVTCALLVIVFEPETFAVIVSVSLLTFRLEIVQSPLESSYVPMLAVEETYCNPAGNLSLITTLLLELGPAFVKVIVNVTLLPMFGVLPLTVFSRLKSALVTIGVVTVLEFGVGSGVLEVALAVFEIGLEVEYVLGTMYVTVIVLVCPFAIVPRLHGKAVMQAPVLETKFNPGGVGSLTLTFCESLGPLFLTVIVYETFVPGVALAGPVLVISRSPLASTGAVTVLELFAASASGVLELALAVFETGSGVA
jgi:hypothetical protein